MNSLKSSVLIALCAAAVTGIYADVIKVSNGYNVEHSIIDNSYSLARDFYRHSYFTGGYEELFCDYSEGAVAYNVQSDIGADFTLLTVKAEISGTVQANSDAFWDLIISTGFFSSNEPAEDGSGSNTLNATIYGNQSFCWNYTASRLVPTNQENMLVFWGQIDDLRSPYSQPYKGSQYLADFNMKISLSAEPIAVPEPCVCSLVLANMAALIGFIYGKKWFLFYIVT